MRRRTRAGAAPLALSLASLALTLTAVTEVAHAHAPESRRVALSRDAAAIAVAIPGFGLLHRARAEASFVYVCDALLGARPTDVVPTLAFLRDGSLLVGSIDGVRVLGPDGCPRSETTREPARDASSDLRDATVIALAAHQGETETAYAVTAGAGGGLWRSRDGGRGWLLRATLALPERVTALLASPDDPELIYLSQPSGQSSTILLSRDGGATLESFPQEGALTLVAVQSGPTPRLWATARDAESVGNRGLSILRSDGPLGPWRSVLRVNYFGGLSIAPDGTLWVGDEGGGVHRSLDGGESFHNVTPDAAVACMTHAGGALWACTPGATAQPALMMLREEQPTLAPVMAFADVQRLVSCASAPPVEQTCAAAWVEWQRDVLMRVAAGVDAGTDAAVDASADPSSAAAAPVLPPQEPADAASAPARAGAGSGCAVQSGRGFPSVLAQVAQLALLTLLTVAVRRSRRATACASSR